MQGVHVAPAINDENSIRVPLLHSAFKENAASQAPSKQGSALKSARKAFGNITNVRSDAAAQQQPAGSVLKRRAFGDITNSTVKQQPGAASTKKEDQFSTHLKPSSTKPPAALVVAAAEACVTAPWWETAPPERPAGKTWEQLLADRERDEDADVERSVQQLLFGFRDLSARCFQVQSDDSSDDDDLVLLGPPPPPLPSYSSRSSRDTSHVQQAAASADCPFGSPRSSVCIADLLPDVELPSTDVEDDAAAAAADVVVSAWPDMEEVLRASSTAAHSNSSDGSWRVCCDSSADGADTTAQQLAVQQPDANMACSPVRAVGSSNDTLVGLKSPEVLPW